MSIKEISDYVLSAAAEFSGDINASPTSYIYKDLNINGEDLIEFYDKLENHFKVNLRPISEEVRHKKSRIFKLNKSVLVAKDLTIQDIIDYLSENYFDKN